MWQASENQYDSVRDEWLKRVSTGSSAGPFQPEWTSLNLCRSPKWYDEARFGISVPAFGSEWYLFKAKKLDPRSWAKLFRKAGARYVVPVAEHQDGFAMYDSQLSDWTAVKVGQRDVLGELRTAIRAEGLHFGLSSHRAEHNGTHVSQAWLDDWLARTAELVTHYEPDLVHFDWWIGHPLFRTTVPKFLAYYYNQGVARGGVVVNYKLQGFAPNAGRLDIEHGQLTDIQERVWQTDASLSNDSRGYIQYQSPALIIHMLADVVSRNGNLLLDVAPRADGTLAEEAQEILREIGVWLQINGEAIYASKPWTKSGDGPTKAQPYTAEDFRFTTRDGYLYAIQLGWPADGETLIRAIKPQTIVRQVRLLATGRIIPFTQSADGLHLMLPKTLPGAHAWVYRIETN